MNQATPRCRLPGGYIDAAGTVHRDVELIPLRGREEEWLAGHGHAPSAARVTQVLSRCVQRIGTIAPVTETVARALLVADRQYLLLALRRLTFGDRVQATLSCPWPQCGEPVDINFSLADVPIAEGTPRQPSYTLDLSVDADLAPVPVAFRLPDGGDQERIAPLLIAQPAEALTQLLAACITRIGPEADGLADQVRDWPAQARFEVEQAMQHHAPHVDLHMDVACPACKRTFTAPFDVQDFFFGELRISRDLLYREVHYLAYHYHWGEQEILDMPREKRRTYIEILADEIGQLNEAYA